MITFSRYEIRTEADEVPLILYASNWKTAEKSQEYQSLLSEKNPGSVQIMEQKYVCNSMDGMREATCEELEQLKDSPDTKILGFDVFYRYFGDQEQSDAKERFSDTAAKPDKWAVWAIRKEAGFTLKEGMELAYQQLKQRNSDRYGKGVFDYLKRWAAMMEALMENGTPVNKIAKQTSIDADIDGITGAMYGSAVETLSEYWEHGEQLREWHNSRYSYKGLGVVDPATIVLESGKAETEDAGTEKMEVEEMKDHAPQMNL